MHYKKNLTALACAAVLLTACGGGSDEPTQEEPPTRRVIVIGDSLSDVGTYGLRYTVQAASGEPYPIWSEWIAARYNGTPLCSAYLATSATTFEPMADCSSYAVAGARIAHPQGADNPLTILQQLQDARAHLGTAGYSAEDLLLIDGGGNDAAALMSAYVLLNLALLTEESPSFEAYASLLRPVLGEPQTAQLLAQPQGPEKAGYAFMQTLAQRFATAIQADVLDAGAQRVLVLNIPDVTRTPRMKPVFEAVAVASVIATGDAQLAEQLQGLLQDWVVRFNDELQLAFATSQQVAILDAFDQIAQWSQHPERFGFINSSDPACPPVDAQAIFPSYDIQLCTDHLLNTQVPPAHAGDGDNWWARYAFSDDFHPTPMGHERMAEAASAAMAARGW